MSAASCDPKCSGGQGTCQSDGRCFCWWGWTGPNATYIISGANKNRILVSEVAVVFCLFWFYVNECFFFVDLLKRSCC